MTLRPGFPISRPADLGLVPDRDMGGFAFSIEHGIFIPEAESEADNFVLPPVWEIRQDYT